MLKFGERSCGPLEVQKSQVPLLHLQASLRKTVYLNDDG
jgi:hypothetical protein